MRKRNIKKQIWLDIKEDELLKRKSKEAGLSEAEFIRTLIKGYRILIIIAISTGIVMNPPRLKCLNTLRIFIQVAVSRQSFL